jgi:hypothetical protein
MPSVSNPFYSNFFRVNLQRIFTRKNHRDKKEIPPKGDEGISLFLVVQFVAETECVSVAV